LLQRTGEIDAHLPFEVVVVEGVAPAKNYGFSRPPLNTTLGNKKNS